MLASAYSVYYIQFYYCCLLCCLFDPFFCLKQYSSWQLKYIPGDLVTFAILTGVEFMEESRRINGLYS